MEIGSKKSPINRKSSSFIIKCSQVPPEFFSDRNIAKKYFRRFGRIKTIAFKTKQQICLVEYTNIESVLNAVEIGGEYNGKIFTIVRYNPPTVSDVNRKKIRLKKPNPNWPDDPEIRSELEAMGGGFLTAADKLQIKQKLKKPTIKLQQQEQHKTVTNDEQSELIEIIIKPVQTIDEKFKILDARDKLLRIYLKKNWELNKKTGPTVGTCPDMCPEKERLLREIQHQVSIYEQNVDKKLDAKLAIKQYSRSSADQETPLPQELRPVDVLQMTMSYLMHSIMDLCDNNDINISEWYHFLWDRTRGIRKDITQQELCCRKSVELVEQCARFHIYCSARLINEDPSVFDQKINTENLTKCLQTLKYMYNDLRLNGIECENESEFRCYIILLNLNDGNFMWEVQQLNRRIQQSKEIQFALEIYSTIDKNNYVRFFKLIKSTTLLNSCLLMRYFIQVRLKAIKILLKSYTSSRMNSIILSVEYLKDLLGFENNQQTIDFLQYYGLSTNTDRTNIILDKTKFYLPELPYCLDRSINLIESKRDNLTIGEIVCGRQLPEKTYEQHQPQNSFDDNGYLSLDYELKRYLFNDDNDNKREIVEQIEEIDGVAQQQEEEMEQEEQAPSPQKIEESPKIDEELLQLQLLEQQRLEQEEERRKQEEIQRQFEEKQRQLEQQRLLLERRRLEELKRAEFLRQQQLEQQERKRRELEFLQQQQQEQQLRKLAEKQKQIHNDVVETINGLIKQIEINLIEERLNEISVKINEFKLRKFVDKWRNYCLKKRKRKAIDFQPIILTKTVNELIEDSYSFTDLLNRKCYKLGQIDDILLDDSRDNIPKLDLSPIYTNLIRNSFNYQSHIIKELFWKISVSLSSICRRIIEPVLDRYFGIVNREIVGKFVKTNQPILYYSIVKDLNIKNDLNGCIFIDNCFNRQLYERISKVALRLPIVLLLENCDNLTQLHDDLNCLINRKIITNYCILINQFTRANLLKNLEKALLFLSENLQPLPPLQLDDLHEFLVKQFENFWCRLHSFTRWNYNYLQLFKQPNLLIYLFNEHLDNLREICLNFDDNERRIQRFADCFKQFLNYENLILPSTYQYFPNFWNNPDYCKDLLMIFNRIKLAKFVDDWPPNDFDDLNRKLRHYCRTNFKTNHQQIYLKLLSLILRQINDNFDKIGEVIWIDLVQFLILQKLKQVDFSLYGTGFVNNSVYNRFVIVYDLKKLIDYNLTDWFYINHPLIKNKIRELLELERQQLKQQNGRNCSLDGGDLASSLLKFDEIKQKSKLFNDKQYCQRLDRDLKRCAELMDDLDESYQIHKKISVKSEELLENILKQ